MKLEMIETDFKNFIFDTRFIFERFTGLVPFKIQEYVLGIIDLFPVHAG